jgi:uncharacterized protein YprB with RNaseH-like and TPR domain
MEIIKKEFRTEPYASSVFNEYFGGRSFCTFDIETQGLDPRRSPLILGGLLDVDAYGNAVLTQYFLDRPEDEHRLLHEMIKDLNRREMIITFNGNRFDVPYTEKRASKILHEEMSVRPYDLDIYLMVKNYSGISSVMPSLKQKSLEEYMGLSSSRDDEISGAESIELYYQFLLEEDEVRRNSIKDKILLHNADDVVQLYRLLPVLKQCDLHKALFKRGFPVYEPHGSMIMKVKDIRVGQRKMTVEGTYTGEAFIYRSYSGMDRLWDIEYSKERTFKIDFPLQKNGSSIFINLLDFFPETGDFRAYGGYVNDYLILREDKEYNYREINAFIRRLLTDIMGGK